MSNVEQYSYRDIVINEFNDFDMTAQLLADAANRALWEVINIYSDIDGLGYYIHTRLLQIGVCPILDDCSEMWNNNKFPHIDAIQNKAIRIFWEFSHCTN